MKENRLDLHLFYNQMIGESVSQGREVVGRFFDKNIPEWKSYSDSDGSVIKLRFDLSKGIVLRSEKNYLGLALGWGKDNRYDERCLRFQFGVQPIDETKDFRDVRNLQSLVKGVWVNFGTGEFYDDGIKVRPNCWANSGIYGGKELSEVDNDSAREIMDRFIQRVF